MTKQQVRSMKKSTALNEIRKIYHPLYKGYDPGPPYESYAEQRDYMVKRIIEKLEKELKEEKK